MGGHYSKINPKINPTASRDRDGAAQSFPLVGQNKIPTQCVENPEGEKAVVIYEDKTFPMKIHLDLKGLGLNYGSCHDGKMPAVKVNDNQCI